MFQTFFISSPNFIAEEIPALVALFEAGLAHFHLRKPHASELELRQFLQKIPSKYHPNIILHQHHDLAKLFFIKGLHFNSFQKIAAHTNYGTLSLSQSVHSFQEIEGLDSRINYAFLSPIFDSISKKNYPSAFTEKELIRFFADYKGSTKIIALGGIAAKNIAKVKALGFAGAAVLGEVWTDFEGDKNIAALVQRYKMLQCP